MNTRAKSYLILLATFALGIGVGVLASRMAGHIHHGWDSGSDISERLKGMLEHHLETVVHPTEDQRKRLLPIFENLKGRLDDVHRQHLELAGPFLDSLDSELETVLTPSQMEKWREFRNARVSEHRKFLK